MTGALVIAVVGCSTLSAAPSDPAPIVTSAADPIRVTYGTDEDNYGHLYLPPGPGPHPVVVMVHGGGWIESNDLSYVEPLSRPLVAEGIAVWNIEYRRVGGTGGWPITLADADDATEALATTVQAAAGGSLDLDRVHLAGHSAGGHLAAWIAGRHTLPPGSPGGQPRIRPRSATIMAGVLDLTLAATTGHDKAVRGLLGGMPDEHPDRYQVASPIAHLPVGLPVTVMHGTADRTVDPVQSQNYADAAIAAGDPATLHLVDGVGHGEFSDVRTAAWAQAHQVILDYVRADDE